MYLKKTVISDATSRKPARARPPPPRLAPTLPSNLPSLSVQPSSQSSNSPSSRLPPPPSAFPSSLPYLARSQIWPPPRRLREARCVTVKPTTAPHRTPREPLVAVHFFQGERITHVSPPRITHPHPHREHNRTTQTRTTAAACYRTAGLGRMPPCQCMLSRFPLSWIASRTAEGRWPHPAMTIQGTCSP